MNLTGSDILQFVIGGISLGSLYALIAIGYTMVYGILRLINFAHGDIFMIGAYFAMYGTKFTNLPWWIVFLSAAIITGLLGVVLEKTAYSPLRNEPRITILISAIGASFLFQNLGVLVFGAKPTSFPIPEILDNNFKLFGATISYVSVVIPIVTVILLIILSYIIKKTTFGMAMRALSKDYEASSLMGININRIISITFFIGSFMAAIGGIFYATRYPQLMPHMGVMPGLKCFIAAVVGGIGNMTGAVIGGLLIGLIEVLVVGFFPSLSGLRDAFAFLILIIILLVKPTGIMGEKLTEKV